MTEVDVADYLVVEANCASGEIAIRNITPEEIQQLEFFADIAKQNEETKAEISKQQSEQKNSVINWLMSREDMTEDVKTALISLLGY